MDRLVAGIAYFTVFTLAAAFGSSTAFSFVLLSGPEEARLPVTPDSPEISFIYEDRAPTINEKEAFEDGKYKDMSDAELFPIILQLAMDKWNSVKGSYLRLKLAGADSARANFNGDDRIFSVVFGEANFSSAALAYPTVEDGKIVDCDIQVASRSTSARSLAYTILHELGHCVGLGHYHTNYNAVMGYSRMDRNLKLGADDMAGEIYLYPDPSVGNTTPKELVSCGVIGGGENPAKFILWLLLGAPFLVSVSLFIRGATKTNRRGHPIHLR